MSTMTAMPLPRPRGPLSVGLLRALTGRRGNLTDTPAVAKSTAPAGVLLDEDVQIELLSLYDLDQGSLGGAAEPRRA